MGMKPSSKVIAKKSSPSKGSKAVMVTCARVSDGQREKSINIRKIENGYILSESTYGGKGGYKSTERFVEKPPVITVAPIKAKK